MFLCLCLSVYSYEYVSVYICVFVHSYAYGPLGTQKFLTLDAVGLGLQLL